jgi:hypothetical protein
MSSLNEFDDLPPAMVVYLASRLTKVSKHAAGHRGEKYRARARRRGAWGSICRRRTLARQRLALTNRSRHALANQAGAVYDEVVGQ